jgi:hypothetical protein
MFQVRWQNLVNYVMKPLFNWGVSFNISKENHLNNLTKSPMRHTVVYVQCQKEESENKVIKWRVMEFRCESGNPSGSFHQYSSLTSYFPERNSDVSRMLPECSTIFFITLGLLDLYESTVDRRRCDSDRLKVLKVCTMRIPLAAEN